MNPIGFTTPFLKSEGEYMTRTRKEELVAEMTTAFKNAACHYRL